MRQIKSTTVLLATVMMLTLTTGCGSKKEVAQGDKAYRRAPIVETTDEAVKNDALMIAAKMAGELGDSKAAIAKYRQVLAHDPHYSAAHYEMSQLMAKDGQLDSALVHARKAVDEGGKNVWYKLQLALIHKHMGDYPKNVKVWESIVKENPDVLEYYYELSNAYLLNNELEKAVGALNRVEKRVGVTEEVSLQKSKLWKAAGKNDRADQEIEALAEALPGETKYNAMLAENAMKSKQYDKAKKYYDRILASDPNDEYIYFSLAQYYKETRQPNKAYEALKKGFEQPSSLSTSNKLRILGTFYTQQEFATPDSKLIELMESALRNNDDSVAYANVYGDVLMQQKRYPEAARQYALALSVDSSQYGVWESMLICESATADYYAMLGDTTNRNLHATRLVDYAKRAQHLFPVHPLPYYLQGYQAFIHEDYSTAIDMLSQCEGLGFTNGYLESETYLLMAESLHATGQNVKAFPYYEKYLERVPTDYMEMNNYAYYLALENTDLDKALSLAKTAVEHLPDNPYCLDTYAWILHLQGNDREATIQIEKALKNSKEISDDEREHYRVITGKEWSH
ncbi:MAG: tetratricopeptide repeat protein [Bacteroidales bacterium]|nr:tetratricopeptide repeat protein [Bacteroidales bacterium]